MQWCLGYAWALRLKVYSSKYSRLHSTGPCSIPKTDKDSLAWLPQAYPLTAATWPMPPTVVLTALVSSLLSPLLRGGGSSTGKSVAMARGSGVTCRQRCVRCVDEVSN
jgi:hypothetical protein